MFRCIKVSRKRSVSTMYCNFRRFHVTSKMSVRKTVRKINVEPENLKHGFDHLLMTKDPNINFLGIESDVGVITVGSPQNKLPEPTKKAILKEKFHKTSFGIVRYDGDNKLKFHGQYKIKTEFLFPRETKPYAEVSVERPQLPNRSSDHSKTLPNNKEMNKYCESSSREQDESYIDKYYFNNISVTENTNCNKSDIHPSSEELNFIDKNYFETLTNSENYISEREHANNNNIQTSPELNSVDKSNFETIKISEKLISEIGKSESSVERELPSKNDVSQSSVEELNFFDEIYFNNSVHTTEKSPNAQEFSGDMLVNPEVAFDCRNGEVAKPNSSERFHRNLKSNITENPQIVTKDSYILPQYAIYDEPATDFASGIKSKRENFRYAEINKNNEQKLKRILSDDFENSDILSDTQKADSLSKQKLEGNITSRIQTVKTDLNENKSKQSSDEETGSVSTAHDFVMKLRKEQEISQQTIKKEKATEVEKFDSKGFRILKNQVDDLTYFTRDEIFNILKQNIVYSDDDLLVLNKPYGLVMHDSRTTKYPCLSTFLDDLAKDLDRNATDPKLFTVHRLDKETTGCLLLARNETMAQYLKSLFAQRKIIKKYWIITTKVPDPREGIIDIPISEGSINNRKRMVLHPKLNKDIAYKNHSRHGREAITSYSVISESGNAALVEALPKTGIKHQIRVHFGFGLSCPILGDHKYSHLDKLVPQKLPSDILQRLNVRQSKVRYIPMHIHAKSVTIPQYFEHRNLFVNIHLPKHMIENLKRLKFRKKK